MRQQPHETTSGRGGAFQSGNVAGDRESVTRGSDNIAGTLSSAKRPRCGLAYKSNAQPCVAPRTDDASSLAA